MPRPKERKDMTAQLGRDHCFSVMFRSTVFASLCSRVVLMSITIRATTGHSNVFIPLFLAARAVQAHHPDGGPT